MPVRVTAWAFFVPKCKVSDSLKNNLKIVGLILGNQVLVIVSLKGQSDEAETKTKSR